MELGGPQSDPVQFVSVIGRGGEQISRIQAESGCKIQIASGKAPLFIDLSLVEIGVLPSFPDFITFTRYLEVRGAWVSISSAVFLAFLEPDSQVRTRRTGAEAGPDTRPSAVPWLPVAPARRLLL